LIDGYGLTIIVNDHTEDMSEFKHKHHLLNEYLANLKQYLLKELIVVVQIYKVKSYYESKVDKNLPHVSMNLGWNACQMH